MSEFMRPGTAFKFRGLVWVLGLEGPEPQTSSVPDFDAPAQQEAAPEPAQQEAAPEPAQQEAAPEPAQQEAAEPAQQEPEPAQQEARSESKTKRRR